MILTKLRGFRNFGPAVSAKLPPVSYLLACAPLRPSYRTQIDLLKPSGRAERRVDALGHYHGRTSQTSHPTGPYVGRIQLEFLTGSFFSHLQQYSGPDSEIITTVQA